MSAACKTLANVRFNAADSLADSNCLNKTVMNHTNTLTVATAFSENTQQNTRLPMPMREICLTPSVDPDCAPLHGNQVFLLSNKDTATQDASPSPHISPSVKYMTQTEEALLNNVTGNITLGTDLTEAENSRDVIDTQSVVEIRAYNWKSEFTEALDEATYDFHGIVLDGVNEMQAQVSKAVNTVNTNKKIAVIDIHREKEDALNSFRNEMALETSAALKEIEMKKMHGMTELAVKDEKSVYARLTEFTLEPTNSITDMRDVLILHSDADRDLANEIMNTIVNECVFKIFIDVYANFATGKSKMDIIDNIMITYRWVLFLVTPDYKLNGFHNFQGGAVLIKELEENGNPHGRFVPLITGGIKRKDIIPAWLKSLQPIYFPDEKFIETIVKLVKQFRKCKITGKSVLYT
ncbi:uncharacterized protein LOC127860114 isoform X2 [Dreissena polymorpha]|nr:uncharacterized protein LOC127860114 isoform X2 [Dreissena polymorpha]KAH3699206.1 hypothetical protein DPMN_074161 [Dreissena polymorpha]